MIKNIPQVKDIKYLVLRHINQLDENTLKYTFRLFDENWIKYRFENNHY